MWSANEVQYPLKYRSPYIPLYSSFRHDTNLGTSLVSRLEWPLGFMYVQTLFRFPLLRAV